MKLLLNKKIIKPIAFFAAISIGSLFIIGSSDINKSKKAHQTEALTKSYEIPQKDFIKKDNQKILSENETENKFIIKEYNGSVAVFENGKNDPIKKTETMVADLPVADREILKKGINAKTQEELSRILEDYCS